MNAIVDEMCDKLRALVRKGYKDIGPAERRKRVALAEQAVSDSLPNVRPPLRNSYGVKSEAK